MFQTLALSIAIVVAIHGAALIGFTFARRRPATHQHAHTATPLLPDGRKS